MMTGLKPLRLLFVGLIVASCSQLQQAHPYVRAVGSTSGLSAPSFRVLHDFGQVSGSSSNYVWDGKSPQAAFVSLNGTLYGTTLYGGSAPVSECRSGCGTVFRITPTGKNYHVVYSFGAQPDGYFPGNLTAINGILYGTTLSGGAHDLGTIFSVSASGKERVLYSFGNGSDGAEPRGELLYLKRRLYGTTLNGGAHGNGTIFSLSLAGVEKILHSFGNRPDGGFPYAGLIEAGGFLYGTTYFGGAHRQGTVFRINPDGTGYRVLYSFSANGVDGYNPEAALVQLGDTLYGTTVNGGSGTDNYYGRPCSCGTVFSFSPATKSEHVLHSFGLYPDGGSPEDALIVVNGTLYGTTSLGNVSNDPDGSVFSITTSGTERVVYSFGPRNYNPVAGLLNVNGTLYGTTVAGGTYNGGISFAVAP